MNFRIVLVISAFGQGSYGMRYSPWGRILTMPKGDISYGKEKIESQNKTLTGQQKLK